ncbi:MAG: hypothetical protein KJO04_06715 [Bacteroidia bacterium]|nr:hypothetical protein [Bacteroidia bacterium]
MNLNKDNIVLRIILSIVLALCVTSAVFAQKKAKLTPEEKENIKSAKVLLVRYEAPPLHIMTPKDAVGAGLVADLTDSDEAKDGMRHRFYPSARIQKDLDSVLRAEGIVSNLEFREDAYEFAMNRELKDLSKYEGTEADYIVEVIVPLMGFQATYMPIKWRKYNLQLGCFIRIIRTSDLALVWKTNAGYTHLQDGDMKFHIDELENDGKALIAGKVEKASYGIALKVAEKFHKAKK